VFAQPFFVVGGEGFVNTAGVEEDGLHSRY
jgi:hypothetical protein